MKECRRKIKKIFNLLSSDSEFEQFSLRDLLQRGRETIEVIRADDDLELEQLKLENLGTAVKHTEGKTVSSPSAMRVVVEILLKLGKLSFSSANNELVQIFEILLSLSILFGADLKAKASESLLETCVVIMGSAAKKLEDIETNDYALDHIVNSKLMKWICSGLNFETTFKANQRKGKLIQMHTLMYQIQGEVLERLNKRINVAAGINRYITDALK